MREVPVEELAADALVVREPGSGTRRVSEERLQAVGLRLEELYIAAELTGIEGIKAAVEAGVRVSILSRATLGKGLGVRHAGRQAARRDAGPSRRVRRDDGRRDELSAVRELTALLAEREL